MKATAKHKVVTSGRLTGGVKVQQARRRATPNPGPSACPEPTYSLYSTDSEDQVATLHKGLDRCAALLGGILQADKAASPSLPGAVKGGATKSRPSTSLGKKTIKKLQRKTVQKNSPSCQRGPGSTTPRGTRPFTATAVHSGMKLHPPQRHLSPGVPKPRSQISASLPLPQHETDVPPPQPQASALLSVRQSSSPSGLPAVCQTECQSPSKAPRARCNTGRDGEEDEFVPVRDTCTTEEHLVPGRPEEASRDPPEGDSCNAEKEVKARTVQYLLGELKALIAGQGSVAERLLTHLEQVVSSPLEDGGTSNIQTETVPDVSSLHGQNAQLRRHVRILTQLLKEKGEAENQQNNEALSEATTLREELAAARRQLLELQDDLAELQKTLQDARSRLRGSEAENALIKTDLETTRSRLAQVEREKSESASLARRRLEEIGHLNRVLQDRDPCVNPTLLNSSDSQGGRRPTGCIAQYLKSLGQLDPTHAGREAAEKEASPPRDAAPRTDDGEPAEADGVGWPLNATAPQCDAESAWSDRSVWSSATFDTRDEAAFRDGLAALDASIASLQRTIQLDLKR